LIGHKNHPEIQGTRGRVKQDVFIVEKVADVINIPYTSEEKIFYVTQTTLSIDDTRAIIDALKGRYPNINGPELDNICYATQNRQNAVKKIAHLVDTIFVIGAENSSNSNRLLDIAELRGVKAYLLNDENDINHRLVDGIQKLGITAGASAPEILVQNLIKKIGAMRNVEVKNVDGVAEDLKFNIPRVLHID
jgi:4-hydroxy-3-methylbut-2-enyl diphosphate reductase